MNSTLHRKITALEEQCARLKQQKRVAEKFASEQQQAADAARQGTDATRQALEKMTARARYFESMYETQLREVHRLRCELSHSFKTRVEHDVFRVIEATGDADMFSHGLMPTLAAVQSKVATAALQRRAARLADPGSDPLGFHPAVNEWACLSDMI